MIPVRFDLVSPTTLREAVAALASDPGARVIAGGQGLIPAMSTHRLAPTLLVDLRLLPDLRGVTADASGLRIGARTTLDEVAASSDVRARAEALAEAARASGDIAVRHRGTLGGALADGHPAGDIIAAAIALGGAATLVGPAGSRSVPAAELVTGPFETSIGRGEILTGLDIPASPARTGSAYVKSRHPGSGFAICGAAAVVTLRDDGGVASVRVALTGATARPALVAGTDAGGDVAAVSQAAGAAVGAGGLTFTSDLAASGEYRAHLARVLAERAVLAAAQRAGDA